MGGAAVAGAAAVGVAGVEEVEMNNAIETRLGLGIGWRPELALDIERRKDLGFVEIVAENVDPDAVPAPLIKLREAGVQVIPHGISLWLGGAEKIDKGRVRRLAGLARRFDSPLVSEHIAFVRAGGMEAGHLLPLPQTESALRVVIDNVKTATDLLEVPLALENISALFEWPDAEMSDAEFVCRVIEGTDTRLLLDVANVWANARNLGGDAIEFLRRVPLDRLAYVHVAGGEERNGVYHDTHAAPVSQPVLEVLGSLCRMTDIPGVMLERDDDFPDTAQLTRELDSIKSLFTRRHDASDETC